MSEPILPLYQAFVASAAALATAQATHDTNARALLAAMPEGALFSTVADPAPLIKRVGDQIIAEPPHYMGLPHPGTV